MEICLRDFRFTKKIIKNNKLIKNLKKFVTDLRHSTTHRQHSYQHAPEKELNKEELMTRKRCCWVLAFLMSKM